MQRILIERFGGLHGVRDPGAVEAAVFRPQIGYYNSLEEEAAALMESLGANHGFVDGNKRIAFAATDVFLRRNGLYLDVSADEGSTSSTVPWTIRNSVFLEFWTGSAATHSRSMTAAAER